MEKFKEWTHPSDALPEESIDRDHILTNVMLYWLTATAGSSAQLYYEIVHTQNWPAPSSIPTAVAAFGEDVSIRRFAEDAHNIVHWSDFTDGEHFAAMEAPDLLVADIRDFLAPLR